ncbi:transposase [Penicillium malachiteum]|uniref:Transposase n=1 Tax=Penicillium malachiteum TaxID=1324776 RepID=A0AAD6HKR6_9EURO|nr:transposase [Penicillium malachiteum]
MIKNTSLTIYEIADAADYSPQTITRIRLTMTLPSTPRACSNHAGPQQRIIPYILKALCDHLQTHPHLYLDEMATFLWENFNIFVSPRTVGRELAETGYETLTYEISISITFHNSAHITWSTWTSQDATNVQDVDGLAGLLVV